MKRRRGITNCVNCGAILHGNVCEYCGTKYNDNGISASFSTDDYTGTMKLGNEEIKVYIGRMESNIIESDAWMDAMGVLHRDKPKIKRKFTVIEI